MRSLSDIVLLRAGQEPDQLAFRFLVDGTGEQAQDWTYRDLARNAASVAGAVGMFRPNPRRIVLALDPGLTYVGALFGVLHAGCTVVPAFPPVGRRAVERFVTIVVDCAPDVVVADPRLADRVAAIESTLPPGHPRPQWLFLPPPEQAGPGTGPPAELGAPVRPAGPALLQYTSGSTGAPKGIEISHDNLVANCVALEASIGAEPDRVGCSWLPPYHDMGLMGTIMHALHGGWPLVMLAPTHFVQRPHRWLQAITDNRVTITVGPNFAFDLCVTGIDDAEAATLDLSSLRQVFCGSEPVSRVTLDRFRERFAPHGYRETSLIPCYGLAEATLYVSGKSPDTPVRTVALDTAALEHGAVLPATGTGGAGPAPGSTTVVSCGPVAAEHHVEIVDPESALPAPPDRIGEIWVRGPNVAGGYLDRPDLTFATFRARLGGDAEHTYLRTGDLGFLHDGELYVTGRIKDVVVVAGRNLYPQDVERTVRDACDRVREAVAFAVTDPATGTEGLAVVAEFRGTARQLASERPELRDELVAAVVIGHGVRPVDLHLAPVGSISITTSGKVRRGATRTAYLEGRIRALSAVDQPVSAR